MYKVSLFNGTNEIVINEIGSKNGNRITGSIKKEINAIDSFQFEILPNNAGYEDIYNLTTLVKVYNTKLHRMEFEGRVLIAKPKMSDKGLFTKSVTCESDLGYLCDSSQRYGKHQNKTVREYLELMIAEHNKNTTEDKHFIVGDVTVRDSNDSIYRFTDYKSTWENIKEDLLDSLGGELRVRHENGVRFLDYLETIGEKKDTVIRLSRNMQSIEEEKDPTSIITRLVPLGNKLRETDERLTIKSVNNGLDYIEDVEAAKTFGVIEKTMSWDDVTTAKILKTKGKDFLSENNRIKKKYSINVLDLSLIGLEADSIGIFNTYRVVNPIMHIDEDLRVIGETIVIENPQTNTFTVGDKFEDIKTYQISLKKLSKNSLKANELSSKALNKVNNLQDITYEMGVTMEESNKNSGDLVEIVSNLASIVEKNTKDLKELSAKIDSISKGVK